GSRRRQVAGHLDQAADAGQSFVGEAIRLVDEEAPAAEVEKGAYVFGHVVHEERLLDFHPGGFARPAIGLCMRLAPKSVEANVIDGRESVGQAELAKDSISVLRRAIREDGLGQIHGVEGAQQLGVGLQTVLLAFGMNGGKEGFRVGESLLYCKPLERSAVILRPLAS